MFDNPNPKFVDRSYWPKGTPRRIAAVLAGVIAVFMAIKAMAYTQGPVVELSDHVFRLVAFGSLTVWATFAMGINRRGSAAVMVLAFASFIELFVIPMRGQPMGTFASANLGIVFAFCGMQLYWFRLSAKTQPKTAQAA
jgi:cytochrome c biogenesis protein CcdA